jgi:hypothetical protein
MHYIKQIIYTPVDYITQGTISCNMAISHITCEIPIK